jgi:hypothetical protein
VQICYSKLHWDRPISCRRSTHGGIGGHFSFCFRKARRSSRAGWCSDNSVDMYSDGFRFESRPSYRLSWEFLWFSSLFRDSVTCNSIPRQRPQHTHGQQYGGSVFFVSAHGPLLCKACGDVTQQCVAITCHVFFVKRGDVTQQCVAITWHVFCVALWRRTTVCNGHVTCFLWCVVRAAAI